jgi:ABC-2 type transport system ATP-binding protein
MIQVRNLSKRFGKVQAIDDITFEVARGEVLGFLGPNGAGKSTTMRALTGFHGVDAGTIRIDERDLRDDPERAKAMIGYLPENNPLQDDQTVLETLRFVGEVRGMKGADLDRAIARNVRLYGLTEKATADVGTLSKGYRQRVGLAMANLHDPPILILDEPTSGLDPNQIAEIRGLIREIGRTKTIILSTHNLAEVEATCTRILIIHRGRIVAHDTPEALERHGRRATVTVQLKADGNAADALRTLPGVAAVEPVEAEPGFAGFALSCEGAGDPREAVFDLAVARGWKIVGMRRETARLEEVFAQLTKN